MDSFKFGDLVMVYRDGSNEVLLGSYINLHTVKDNILCSCVEYYTKYGYRRMEPVNNIKPPTILFRLLYV